MRYYKRKTIVLINRVLVLGSERQVTSASLEGLSGDGMLEGLSVRQRVTSVSSEGFSSGEILCRVNC